MRPSLAWQLEDRLSKDQILTQYLNTVYFGEGAYGIASRGADLLRRRRGRSHAGADPPCSPGSITAPNHFDPYIHVGSATGRRDVVLRLMLHEGYDPTGARSSTRVHETVELRRSTDETTYPYPYFVDYFKRWFLSNPAFGATRDDRYRLLFTGRASDHHHA